MAHFAIIGSNNIVEQVITGKDENDLEGLPEEFSSWEEYLSNRFSKKVLRTSYNTYHNQHNDGGTPFRGNYAGIGYTYSEQLDAFIPPKFYASWVLDTTIMDYVAPVEKPVDNNNNDTNYLWDEANQQWLKESDIPIEDLHLYVL
jgi:hypothetical protein